MIVLPSFEKDSLEKIAKKVPKQNGNKIFKTRSLLINFLMDTCGADTKKYIFFKYLCFYVLLV